MSPLRMWQRHTRLQVSHGVVWLLLMAWPILVYAEQFTGKVVGISDGDTLSVLREGKAVKVRAGPKNVVGPFLALGDSRHWFRFV